MKNDSQAAKLKQEAAIRAVEFVRDGMKVGLGTGSTARFAVLELGRRVSEGLRITGVPTSEQTAKLARSLGIALATLDDAGRLDITIDGADEVNLTTFDAIKGLGGALLREKLVAVATEIETLIVDEGKVVETLGSRAPLPVEVVAFGWSNTSATLAGLGCEATLRRSEDGQPYVTDGGNYIIDCRFPGIKHPHELGLRIKQITGVIEHGLFAGIVRRIVVAGGSVVQVYEKG